MLDFFNSKLLPKITCKSPCTDNYEAENLISDQYTTKLRGFIAYPSIKPPVEIEIELLCKVDIFYIVLNTTVGNQRCSGIEVFAKNPNSSYVSICNATYDKQGVIFCNSRKYSKDSPPPCFDSNYSLSFFKSNTFRSFLDASMIKIVIFRTDKSVPCLGSVEVWGVPSKNCSPKTRDTVYKLMGAITDKKSVPNVENAYGTDNKNDFSIPDDFKDDLTYEIMTVPMTLPSGKSIDQSTLEKHIKSEESFGRKPCDPFTGVKFNERLKPVLNVGLKSRIDMFLLENSHRPETFSLKRTLGGGKLVDSNNFSSKSKKIYCGSIERYGNCNDTFDKTSPSDISIDTVDVLINQAKKDANFVSFTIKPEKTSCILCNNVFQFLYLLPCEHLYCRNCLLEVCKELRCSTCKKNFIKSDVKKCDL